MKIEKPISTIRKAIKGSAEQMASREFLEEPEERHYKDTFDFFRALKMLQPEMYEKMIVVGAKGQELSERIGKDSHKILTGVLREIAAKDKEDLKQAVESMRNTRNLSSEELEREIFKLKERYFNNVVTKEILNDPRLKSAFAGKEELLIKVVDFFKYAMTEFNEIN